MSDWYRDFANSGSAAPSPSSSGCPGRPCCAATSPASRCWPGPLLVGVGRRRPAARRRSGRARRGRRASVAADRDAGRARSWPRVVLDATGLTDAGRSGRGARLPRPGGEAAGPPRAGCCVLGDPPGEASAPAAGRGPAGPGRPGPLDRQGAARRRHRQPARRARRAPRPPSPGPLRFFLSGRSAYVDGQVVTPAPRPTSPGRRTTRDDARWPARSPSSPGRPAASAPRSPTCWPATARTSSPSTSRPPASRWPTVANGSAAPRCSSTSPPPTPPQRLVDHLARAARRGRHRGAQRRHHPRQAAGQHGRRALELGAGGQPAGPAATYPGPAGRRRARCGPAPGWSACQLPVRHRRQPRADQLRGVQGRRDRHGAGAGPRRSPRAARPSTPSRPGSSSPR